MDARVKVVINLMRDSMAHELSIGALSRSVNLSSARLRQLFKTATGRSPISYIKYLRMNRAEDLLLTTFLSIKEIAFRIGAKDVSHFVRDFKKNRGVTPTQFRQEAGHATRLGNCE